MDLSGIFNGYNSLNYIQTVGLVVMAIFLVKRGIVIQGKDGKKIAIGQTGKSESDKYKKDKHRINSDDMRLLSDFYVQIYGVDRENLIGYHVFGTLKDNMERSLDINHINWDIEKYLNQYMRDTSGFIHRQMWRAIEGSGANTRLSESDFNSLVLIVHKIMERNK
ncbi:MAG: hypothetical protein FWE23_08880 [Chitinivibrionia bacterium]|nr:hypothetical protein [Chitinivibrionia bacterium]